MLGGKDFRATQNRKAQNSECAGTPIFFPLARQRGGGSRIGSKGNGGIG